MVVAFSEERRGIVQIAEIFFLATSLASGVAYPGGWFAGDFNSCGEILHLSMSRIWLFRKQFQQPNGISLHIL
jgi:hypothetical protein